MRLAVAAVPLYATASSIGMAAQDCQDRASQSLGRPIAEVLASVDSLANFSFNIGNKKPNLSAHSSTEKHRPVIIQKRSKNGTARSYRIIGGNIFTRSVASLVSDD
jgi:hypothetical protein